MSLFLALCLTRKKQSGSINWRPFNDQAPCISGHRLPTDKLPELNVSAVWNLIHHPVGFFILHEGALDEI